MTTYEVLHGDCRETLKTLPDESVHCVVTSPPYFGLRDYGTGKWEGGDAECSHENAFGKSRYDYKLNPGLGTTGVQDQSSNAASALRPVAEECPDCGAIRIDDQIGLEETPDAFVGALVDVFREVKRVLHPSGTVWLNLGDTYGDKQLLGIPWRVAFALQADGWVLRQSIVWAKSKTMPEPVRDRCTRSHELIFMFAKQPRYFYDHVAIKEPVGQATLAAVHRGERQTLEQYKHDEGSRLGKRSPNHMFSNKEALDRMAAGRNKRDVWTINPKAFTGAHFAVYPPELIEPCVLAGTSAHGACADCGTPWVRNHNDSWRPDCECRGELVREEVVIPAKMTQEQLLEAGWGANSDSGYGGENQKDYASAMAQGASDVKRRIIENATKERRKNVWVYRSDVPLEEHPVVPCVVLDPFGGSGTTAGVAIKHGRQAILCELNPDFAAIMDERIRSIAEFVEEDVEDMEWL